MRRPIFAEGSMSAHHRLLERIYAAAPVNGFIHPTMRVDEAAAVISAPVRPEWFHTGGAVHGAIYFKLLDDACFFAANSLVEGVFVLTADFHIRMLRPVSSGVLTATGRVVNRGRRVLVADGELRDDRGRLVATGSGSFMLSEIELEGLPGS